jgi:hypothetical protein
MPCCYDFNLSDPPYKKREVRLGAGLTSSKIMRVDFGVLYVEVGGVMSYTFPGGWGATFSSK